MSKNNGFTIVELLVVIVVIGILAAVTIVSYSGVSQKSTEASVQSDLTNALKQIELFKVSNGNYPTAINCSSPSATEICLKPSGTNSFSDYNYDNSSLFLISKNGNTCYEIESSGAPVLSALCTYPWMTFGSQKWGKFNLNVGTMITGTTNQTNNAVLEKYCYSNLESNCTSYGALYQWDEAMQYVTTAGAKGICPVGSHIPTDAEWTTLANYLGSATAGTQLIPGGSSGMNIPLAGARNTGGTFGNMPTYAMLWTSSESGANASYRYIHTSGGAVNPTTATKIVGNSVRCLKN